MYTPASSSGSRSARFHSVEASIGQTGTLDLYVDMSAATGNTKLRFAQINGNGSDVLEVGVSTDGGNNFNTVLASNVPNNGSAVVNLPSISTTLARIKVKASNSIFFDNGEDGTTHFTAADNADGFSEQDFFGDDARDNQFDVDPELGDIESLVSPNFVPASDSPAADGAATPPDDGFF